MGRLGVTLVALFVILAGSAPAGAVTVISGGCAMEIRLTLSAGELNITTPVRGTCVASAGSMVGQGTLNGNLEPVDSTVPFTCAQAVGDGFIELRLWLDGNQFSWELKAQISAGAGGVMSINFASLNDPHIVGTGTFVQDSPTAAQGCLAGATVTNWTGTVAWEDPVIE
jgi:hypothetical protein